MIKRVVCAVLVLTLLNLMVGCIQYQKVKLLKEEIPMHTGYELIVEVVLTSGEVVEFDLRGGTYNRALDVIWGVTLDGSRTDIEMDDVLYIRVKKVDPARNLLATAGCLAASAAGALLMFALLKESCPFVYSYNGTNYVFDAEPLGGAISQGLAKTDYSLLEHLEPLEGKYLLLLRNEVDETQYIDEIKLLVVDHSISSEVIPDLLGDMYTVDKPISPSSVWDENGMDLMNFMKQRDDIAWQTHLPTDSSYKDQNLRHELTFVFPKPEDAKSAKLLVTAGTALWGSNMIREMLQLRGDRVDAWYDAVNRGGPELFELIQFIEREELYLLKIYVKERESWVQRGFIPGGGPLIHEDRAIHLDLSNVHEDSVIIRLNPPSGFWAIDYLGLEYGSYSPSLVKEIPLSWAEDQYGNDVSEVLSSTDREYLVLPEVGNWTKVNFDVPSQHEQTKRSIFLQASGYYEIHISKDQPEQTELIQKLSATPGAIVEYSMDQYLEWLSQQLVSR